MTSNSIRRISMKSLYVTSVERFSGKTATCLAIGTRLKADGYRVGYLKPLSLQPWMISGKIADEDAGFVKEILELNLEPWELSPIVLTPEYLRTYLTDINHEDLMKKIKEAHDLAGYDKDVLLLEGGGSLREGYVVGLPTPAVARELDTQVLAIVKYRDEVRLLDDTLAAQERLGDTLCGVLINRVPKESLEFVDEIARPFFEKRGISIFGVLPEERGLSAITVGEIIDVIDAEVLTSDIRREALVQNLTVGAMTAEVALRRFRRYPNKAVITGGDRTDIQLAALDTSTTCLVLTGNLHPNPLVVKQAEEFGVAVLLVRTNTMETVEAIERIIGKTRLGQASKLQQFKELLEEHCDCTQFYKAIGLK
jgi:BioD-like phosphotransacetylase family protein